MNPQTPDGNTAFQAYLQQHHLEALDVAIKSGVRYLVVWNILHHHPVTSAQAAQVRAGLQRMTGIAYKVLTGMFLSFILIITNGK